MAQFDVVQFFPNKAGAWPPGAMAPPMAMELPFMLAVAGLGAPVHDRPLLFETIQLHIDLASNLISCPNLGPLAAAAHLPHLSSGLKRFASESVGLAAAAAFAEQWHGWIPELGWPTDLDLNAAPGEARPDLLFPVPGGQIAAECRGRTGSRQTLRPAPAQTERMDCLNPWQIAHTKVFMAWAWISPGSTRIDYFDPGSIREVVDGDVLADSLARSARALYRAAIEADIPETRTGTGTVRGDWNVRVGSAFELFVGVAEPDTLTLPQSAARAGRAVSQDPEYAQVGPVVVAARPHGSTRPIEDFRDR